MTRKGLWICDSPSRRPPWSELGRPRFEGSHLRLRDKAVSRVPLSLGALRAAPQAPRCWRSERDGFRIGGGPGRRNRQGALQRALRQPDFRELARKWPRSPYAPRSRRRQRACGSRPLTCDLPHDARTRRMEGASRGPGRPSGKRPGARYVRLLYGFPGSRWVRPGQAHKGWWRAAASGATPTRADSPASRTRRQIQVLRKGSFSRSSPDTRTGLASWTECDHVARRHREPLWQRGTVCSEPGLDMHERPLLRPGSRGRRGRAASASHRCRRGTIV